MDKKLIGEGTRPLVCAPLVGTNQEVIAEQLNQVLKKNPDILEWRADFFKQIADTKAVITVAKQIKAVAGATPIIFTIRSVREGGQSISLSDRQAIELNAEICRQTEIEYVDCELSNVTEDIKYLREVATGYGTKIIGSFHNFQLTPSREELNSKFNAAVQHQLDVAKVAVMPQNLEDVLTLLSVTNEAKQRLSIPLITMSMGKYGALSRLIGGIFGSSLTFAVGAKSSAPGQVPIEDVKTVLDILDRSLGG